MRALAILIAITFCFSSLPFWPQEEQVIFGSKSFRLTDKQFNNFTGNSPWETALSNALENTIGIIDTTPDYLSRKSRLNIVSGSSFLIKAGTAVHLSCLMNKDDTKLPNFDYTFQEGYSFSAGVLLQGKTVRPLIELVWDKSKVGYSGSFSHQWCYDPPDTDSCYTELVRFEGYNQFERYGANLGLSTMLNSRKNVWYFSSALAYRRMKWYESNFIDNSYTVHILNSGSKIELDEGLKRLSKHQLGARFDLALIRKLGHIHIKLGPSASWYFSDYEEKDYGDGSFMYPIGYPIGGNNRTSKTHIIMFGLSVEFILSNTL